MNISHWFKKASIRYKLIAIIMGVTLMSMLVVRATEIVFEYASMRASITAEINSTSQVIGQTVASALDFFDQDAARSNMDALRYQPSIRRACLYDVDRNLFAWHQNQQAGAASSQAIQTEDSLCADTLRADTQSSTWNFLRIYHPIALHGNDLGILYIEYAMDDDHWQFIRDELIAFLIIIMALVVAYMIASWLQKYITVPVVHLAGVASVLADQQDYSVRAHKENDAILR